MGSKRISPERQGAHPASGEGKLKLTKAPRSPIAAAEFHTPHFLVSTCIEAVLSNEAGWTCVAQSRGGWNGNAGMRRTAGLAFTARVQQILTFSRKGGLDDPNCAHRASTFRACALCEHRDYPGHRSAIHSCLRGARAQRAAQPYKPRRARLLSRAGPAIRQSAIPRPAALDTSPPSLYAVARWEPHQARKS